MSNGNIRVGWLRPPSMFSGRDGHDKSSQYISQPPELHQTPPPSLPEVTCRHFSSFKIINCWHSVCRAAPSQLAGPHHPRISLCHRDNKYRQRVQHISISLGTWYVGTTHQPQPRHRVQHISDLSLSSSWVVNPVHWLSLKSPGSAINWLLN